MEMLIFLLIDLMMFINYQKKKKNEIPKFIKKLDKIGFNTLGYAIPKLRRLNSNENECD